VKFSVTGDPLEALSYAGGEEVRKIPDIPERLWLEWKNAGAVE